MENASLMQEVALYFFSSSIFLYCVSLCGVESLQSYKTVLRCLSGVGVVMGFSVWCEFGEYFDQVEKVYDRDAFGFVAIIFFIISILTIQKTKLPPSKRADQGEIQKEIPLLTREQTEEWKGWMQFLFLMYHYFNAKEVYNPIRCLVSAYAFLTGYGNFIYFYKRKDYSFQRFIFMMWRLNFLTVVLMGCMNVPYILYYIVPLHTFYFCVTYAIMGIGKSWNDDRWKLSLKLMISYGIIWYIWDGPISEDIFELIFTPLSPILSMDGSLREWHFRSYLDHYSTLFGIVFAFNLDQLSKFFYFTEKKSKPVEFLMKGIVLFGIGFVFFEWYFNILLMESRFEYNKFHPYFVVIPLVTYIYVRNMTPTLRSYHSELCRIFGGLTLETYLMQYHLFLSGYAKYLLGFLPGYSLTNLLITFSLLCGVAQLLFSWTITLRDPICKFSCLSDFRNRIGNAIVILALLMTVSIFCTPLVGITVCVCFASIILFLFRKKSLSMLFSLPPSNAQDSRQAIP